MGTTRLQISVYQGRQLRSTHPLRSGTYVVGRGEECDIVVSHEAVSRRHLTLRVEDGDLEAVDMDTPNGTFVNGRRAPRQRLLVGDRIELGSWSLLVDLAPVDDALPPLPPMPGTVPPEEATMRASAEQMAELRDRARELRAAHLVWAGDGGPRQRALGDAGVGIGFGPAADVQLVGSAPFAKLVAEVRPEGSKWVLTPATSLVSVRVAGHRIRRHVLGDGETIEIKGQRLRFRAAVD